MAVSHSKYYQAVGRRKEAVARVRILPGSGMVMVNGKPITEVYPGEYFHKLYEKPFIATKSAGQYATTVKVEGGGKTSQLDAIIFGISRALAKISSDYHLALRQDGLLTRDPRVKERRKYGLAHKARAQKSSPKR